MSSDVSGMTGREQMGSGVATLPRPSRWRENPERLAWAVILVSFTLFLVLAVTVPLAIRYGLR